MQARVSETDHDPIVRLRRVFWTAYACLASATVAAQCKAEISVAMDIACSTEGGCETNWSKQAAGVAGNLCAPFCYRISVTNSGSAALRNITVTDDVFGDLTAYFNFPATFSPGDFRTALLQASLCSGVTNTVLAVGQKTSSSHTVTNSDHAGCHAPPD